MNKISWRHFVIFKWIFWITSLNQKKGMETSCRQRQSHLDDDGRFNRCISECKWDKRSISWFWHQTDVSCPVDIVHHFSTLSNVFSFFRDHDVHFRYPFNAWSHRDGHIVDWDAIWILFLNWPLNDECLKENVWFEGKKDTNALHFFNSSSTENSMTFSMKSNLDRKCIIMNWSLKCNFVGWFEIQKLLFHFRNVNVRWTVNLFARLFAWFSISFNDFDLCHCQ